MSLFKPPNPHLTPLALPHLMPHWRKVHLSLPPIQTIKLKTLPQVVRHWRKAHVSLPPMQTTNLMTLPQVVRHWRKALDPLSREQILHAYGAHGCLLAGGVLVGKLARYRCVCVRACACACACVRAKMGNMG